MGQFFCTSVDEPQGDMEFVVESMKAMNAEAIPGEEERKGCSGHIGKTIFSAGTQQLSVVAYVPEAKVPELSCEEWLKATLALFQGEVLTVSPTLCTSRVSANSDKGVFPLKIREPMILEANNFLRKKGLFPEDNDSDDDEMVFGDDDFPSAKNAEEKAAPVDAEKPKLTPEQEKALKKVVKEGGKRGVEIEGAADMGGLQFFCTSVDEPEGDIVLLKESLKAMNAEAIPGEEERKGCSGHIGKTIFSCGTEQLAVIAYVPEAKLSELSCEEWLAQTLSIFHGEVVEKGEQICVGVVRANSDKGIFPLKIREPMILEANNFPRKKGLFPEDKDSDDDDPVFGDDGFPSM